MNPENLKRMAELVGDELFEAHRGIVHLKDDDFLIFGNDGFSEDDRAKREVAYVREFLMLQGATEIGFALNSDGYSWVMLVRQTLTTASGKDIFLSLLTAVLWQGWTSNGEQDGFEKYQSAIAEFAINKIRPQILELAK